MRRALAVTCAVLAFTTLSLTAPPTAWADGVTRLGGAGVSQIGPDLRVLAIDARPDGAGGANGSVSFVHVAPAGVSRFVGTIACLGTDGTGQVQLSGRVRSGQTAAGVVLTGKDFFFTLVTDESPQSFSLPAFADPGTRSGCSGGRPERVPVSSGRFWQTP